MSARRLAGRAVAHSPSPVLQFPIMLRLFMSWIFVIEEDQMLFEQIAEAVSLIEPKIAIIRFLESKAFLDWMTRFAQHDPQLEPAPPVDQFLGIVTSVESWKFRDVKLIGKFKALFVQKGLAVNEDNLGVVFTGYEADALHNKRFENRAVNNFIYKPFDKIVLRQMLEIAFSGRHSVKKYYVHNLKLDSQIEMLKEIVSTSLTEVGFQTISDQPVESGKISKYYAKFLETDQHRSALAQVLTADNGARPISVYLRFFALDQQQSFNLQKLVREKSKNIPLLGTPEAAENFEFLFVTHPKSTLCQAIQPTVERFYDHPVHSVASLAELDQHLGPHNKVESATRRFLFIDRANVIGNEVAELNGILNSYPALKLSVFVLSPKIFTEKIELELSPICEDVFYHPFNKSYFMKGLKQRWPGLRAKEELFEARREFEQNIHVSNPVKMVQVSEAGLVIEYGREIALGEFREFVFWMANEVDVPTLVAQCNFTEKVEGEKPFHCHFVFFGLQEAELKFIRLWMRHQYIETKQKEQSE